MRICCLLRCKCACSKNSRTKDRTRLGWIGVDLRAGAGLEGGRSGSSKSSPHHLGVWAGFSAENFPQLVCERAGTGGELLSGMQGPSLQGATATGTKSPPRTKSFGVVPIGGRSKWAGTGTWASRLAHPSCTIGADLEREDQGSDCERRPKKATSEKEERERKRRRKRRMHATTRQSRSNPRSFARSYCLLLGVFPFFPLPSVSTYESKCLEGKHSIHAQSAINVCPSIWSSAAARVQKEATFRHPSHSTASSGHSRQQQPDRLSAHCLLLSDPQTHCQQWQHSAISRDGHLDGARHCPCPWLRLLSSDSAYRAALH